MFKLLETGKSKKKNRAASLSTCMLATVVNKMLATRRFYFFVRLFPVSLCAWDTVLVPHTYSVAF